MALTTAVATTEDDDVRGHVYRLGGQPAERPDGPDIFLVHSMALSGIDRRLRRTRRDPGAVLDEDKPRRRLFRRSR
jgi:hypothetical protein